MGQHFEHLVEYALAVCKECGHGVLPSQVKSHVQRAHLAKCKQAKLIADEVSSSAGLVEYAIELEVLSQVAEPIQQLPVYTDGMSCQLDHNRCRRIFRSEGVMRKHWRVAYDWSVAEKSGRPTRVQQRSIRDRISKNCKTVHCQRLMVQGQGLRFFEIQQPGENGPDVVPDGDTAWAQVGEQMAKALADIETQTQETGARGREGNPRLERTQWLPYLVSMEQPGLTTRIKEPAAVPNPRQEQQAKPIEAAM